MNKLVIYFFLLLILSNCGFDNKELEDQNANSKIIFEKSKIIKKELNSNLKIKLNKLTKGEVFLGNNTNRTGNINFETNFKKTSSYKFSSIDEFDFNQPELIFTNDESIVFFDGKGDIRAAAERSVNSITDAVMVGDLDAVKGHLKRGSNIEQTNEKGETLLHIAAFFAYPEVVQFLLKECNVDVNTTNQNGWTAFMSATSNGHKNRIFSGPVRFCFFQPWSCSGGMLELVFAQNCWHLNGVRMVLQWRCI